MDDDPEFYEPDEWRGRRADDKQGSSEAVAGSSFACKGLENNLYTMDLFI